MDKSTAINVFEVKAIKKDFSYKIASADVFNEFLYVGDEKGNIYSYPVRANDPDIIAKSTNEQSKNITKSRIDKLVCYPAISCLVVLSDEKLFVIDSALRKPQQIAVKVNLKTIQIHDFAINENFVKEAKEGALNSIVAISRKKEGSIFYFNPTDKKFVESKKFPISDLPTCIGYTGSYILLAYKKDYEVLNVDKNFALKKGSIQGILLIYSAKFPFLKVTNAGEVLFFMDDIGLFMDPQFMPKQKDNVFVNKPIMNITLCGNYCLILCENLLQIYSTCIPKIMQSIRKNSI